MKTVGSVQLGHLFVAIAFVGLLSLPAAIPTSVPIYYPAQRTFVHGPDGAPLPLSAYPGDLPLLEERLAGDVGAQEPDMDFASDGSALYYSWVTTQDNAISYAHRNSILRTSDEGATWTDVTPTLLRTDPSGDPVVYRDPLSGRVFLTTYQEVAHVHFSDDAGETWTYVAPVIGVVLTDFPRLFSVPALPGETIGGYPSVLFLCYFSGLSQECRRSFDGGLTWQPTTSPFLPSTTFNLRCGAWSDGKMGGSTIDRTLYVPLILHEEATSLEGYLGCQDPVSGTWGPYEVWVSISRDLGLTWDLVRVAAPLGEYGDASVRIAGDSSGNTYLAYIGADDRPKLSVSQDQGATWSTPIDVGAPGVTAAKLPSLVAGDAGKIALFYVATTVPGGFEAPEELEAEATWHGYAAFSLNALDASPVFATTLSSDPSDPLRRGPCEGRCVLDDTVCSIDCSVGSAIQGMFDYTSTKIHPLTGAAWMALVDMCTDACAEPGATSAAGSTLRASIALQTEGTKVTE